MSINKSLPRIAGRKSIKQELYPGIYHICSCGLSSLQPFCDGSHKGSEFEPIRLDVIETKIYSLCTCKHSLKMPICDGAHKTLPLTENI